MVVVRVTVPSGRGVALSDQYNCKAEDLFYRSYNLLGYSSTAWLRMQIKIRVRSEAT
jgi:hypothetical protein